MNLAGTIFHSKGAKQSGPASTEVEHSLRKIFVEGDRGSNLAENLSFQTRSIANASNV